MTDLIHTVNPVFGEDTKKKSEVWKFFGPCFQNGVLIQDGLLYCKVCVDNKTSIDSKYSTKTSSSNLASHLRLQHGIEVVTSKHAGNRTVNILNSDFTPSSSTIRKTILARRLALTLVRDLLPFSLVTGSGFQDFLFLEKIVNKKEDIPSDRTLATSALNDLYIICHDETKKILSVSPSTLSIELDMTTSTNGNVPLITIIVSFINSKHELQSVCIGTVLFARPQTGERIAEIVHNKLQIFGIQDRKLLMTGDNGRNVIKSSQKINGVLSFFHCIGHSIHLILMKDLPSHVEWENVGTVIDKVRKSHGKICYQLYKLKELHNLHNRNAVLTYLRECEEAMEAWISDEELPVFFGSDDVNDILAEEYQNAVLNVDSSFSTFKKPNATRWYSSYEMLRSYNKNHETINQLLQQTKNSHLILTDIELEIFMEVMDLFAIFHKSLTLLQTGNDISVHLVLLLYDELYSEIESKINSSVHIPFAFTQALNSLKERFKVSNFFIGAAILDPGQVNLSIISKYLSLNNISNVQLIKNLISDLNILVEPEIQNIQPTTTFHYQNLPKITPAKRIRLEYIERCNSQPQEVSAITIEIEFSKYLLQSLRYDPQKEEIFDFWANNRNQFPRLYMLAKIILAIAPMSSRSERNFSILNVVLNKKRSAMCPERAHRVLFLHDNIDILMNALNED